MNRPLLITAGIAIIVTVLGVWLYLIFFGAPEEPREIFSNLGFIKTTQPTTITPPVVTQPTVENPLVDTKAGQLRQLTTRPVAGFATASTSSGTVVRYAEKGTGHLYEINLTTGEETILSRTTTAETASAVFSPQATAVALTALDNYTTRVFVGAIGDEKITGISLEPGAENIAFASETEVLYSIVRDGITTGYRHNLKTATRTEVFTFSFGELDVVWGADINQTYLITKPSPNLEGFIYTTQNNKVTPVIEPGYGLSAMVANDAIVTTRKVNGAYTSELWHGTSTTPLPLLAIKEKCTFNRYDSTYFWCAAPSVQPDATYIDDWYKGTTVANDYLWFIDSNKQTAELIARPESLVSRTLDVVDITSGKNVPSLFFKNRTDQTLWQLDLMP
jgi:hypothetical protein